MQINDQKRLTMMTWIDLSAVISPECSLPRVTAVFRRYYAAPVLSRPAHSLCYRFDGSRLFTVARRPLQTPCSSAAGYWDDRRVTARSNIDGRNLSRFHALRSDCGSTQKRPFRYANWPFGTGEFRRTQLCSAPSLCQICQQCLMDRTVMPQTLINYSFHGHLSRQRAPRGADDTHRSRKTLPRWALNLIDGRFVIYDKDLDTICAHI